MWSSPKQHKRPHQLGAIKTDSQLTKGTFIRTWRDSVLSFAMHQGTL